MLPYSMRCCKEPDVRKKVSRGYHVCINCGLVGKKIYVASSGYEDDLRMRKKSVHNRGKWFEKTARVYVNHKYVDLACEKFVDLLFAYGDLKLIKGRNLSNYLWHLKKVCELFEYKTNIEIRPKPIKPSTEKLYQERFDKAAKHIGWIL